jgi:Domain of unknown function (DUF4124)
MRFFPTYLILLAAAPLVAADAYRWVDKDGVVHFSDQPVAGAQKVPLKPAAKPGSVAPTYAPPNSSTEREGPPQGSFRYAACSIASPTQDETFSSTDTIGIGLDLQPSFRAGDRIQVALNGERLQQWPESATSFLLSGLPRGSYSISVTVLGRGGDVMCTAAPIGFYVQQPSLLSPGHKLAPR